MLRKTQEKWLGKHVKMFRKKREKWLIKNVKNVLENTGKMFEKKREKCLGKNKKKVSLSLDYSSNALSLYSNASYFHSLILTLSTRRFPPESVPVFNIYASFPT